MDNTVISRIRELVGGNNVIETKPDMLQYLKGNGKPLAVVLPANASDVADIVKLANEFSVKITVGGSVVETNGLDLSLIHI